MNIIEAISELTNPDKAAYRKIWITDEYQPLVYGSACGSLFCEDGTNYCPTIDDITATDWCVIT